MRLQKIILPCAKAASDSKSKYVFVLLRNWYQISTTNPTRFYSNKSINTFVV